MRIQIAIKGFFLNATGLKSDFSIAIEQMNIEDTDCYTLHMHMLKIMNLKARDNHSFSIRSLM